MTKSNPFSRKVTVFHDRVAPEEGYLAGYALLIDLLNTQEILVPLPDRLSLVTGKYQRYNTEQWQIFTTRHAPGPDLGSHLVFALKYEGLDLHILKAIFQYAGAEQIRDIIMKEPTGRYTKRLWFLYEWLLGTRLDIPDLKTGAYVEVLDPEHQYPGPIRNSTRHRVKNNLPGTPEFCPLIRRTEKLEKFIALRFDQQIDKNLSKIDRGLLRRTAAFLLLKDSKASFAIEGEYPPDIRARNWGKAIGQAGKQPLSILEIERLQHLVIGSKKLRHMGIRDGEGFIGEHDSDTFAPIPHHISARAKDLPSLLNGLIDTDIMLSKSDYDAVLAATTIAFSFVFIHPLLDGNGRIHRYLIHHVLANMGYTKRDMIFPVSSSFLNHMADYQDVLEVYSAPRLELIQWEATKEHNVQILNETIDLYRYYDLTRQAEFLYTCVQDTIEHIIPHELDYLERYDKLTAMINNSLSLPDSRVDLLIKFIQQNKGVLSKGKRESHFAELTDDEVEMVERYYAESF